MVRAQASTEFIVIMSISFIALLILSTIALEYFYSVRAQRDYGDALSAVQTLAEEADNVYLQGTGAEKTVPITLPGTTVFSPNVTYIGRPLTDQFSGKSNTISIGLNGTLLTATTAATVVGAFPTSAGVHYMQITSHGNFVSIGAHLLSASPDSVFQSMGKSSSESSTVTFLVEMTSSTNESVNVSISSPMEGSQYANAHLTITPVSFTSFGLGDVPVSLDFNTESGAVGIYTSVLNVVAIKQNVNGTPIANETFIVPITLEVSG